MLHTCYPSQNYIRSVYNICKLKHTMIFVIFPILSVSLLGVTSEAGF